MLMFDDTTFTLWSQLIGAGMVGELAGEHLLRHPAHIVGFDDLRDKVVACRCCCGRPAAPGTSPGVPATGRSRAARSMRSRTTTPSGSRGRLSGPRPRSANLAVGEVRRLLAAAILLTTMTLAAASSCA